jgi:glycosyltransferase involved in cell wall biosynthesis
VPASEPFAIVIPCRNEAATIHSIVRSALEHSPLVIVIDDGSTDGTSSQASSAGAIVLRHRASEGKGTALARGFRHAITRGCTWAIAMDGDGQHAVTDIPRFLARLPEHPQIVIGNRMGEAAAIPWLRRVVNRWMSARISELAGASLPDTQCGFRLIHLPTWSSLSLRTRHFQYESEMLLQIARRGLKIEFVPIQVIYRNERSKIHPWRDTVRWIKWWRAAHTTPAEDATPILKPAEIS